MGEIVIQDLRTNKEDRTEYKVINVEVPAMAFIGGEKKRFYNEYELVERIKALVKKEGNDATLGEEVRKLFPL